MPKMPNLRRVRLRALMTQEDLARKARISVATLSRIEGGADARISTARALANALDVQPDELLGAE